MLNLKNAYDLSQVIKVIAENNLKSDDFCLYTEAYAPHAVDGLVVYLDKYPTVNDEDEEIYPDFVTKNELELFMYGEQFVDVLKSAINQKENVSIQEFIAGINYYLDNDAFISLEQ